MSRKFRFVIFIVSIATLLAACTGGSDAASQENALPTIAIVRHPQPEDYSFIDRNPTVPTYDPNSTNPFQVDFRSADLQRLDLSQSWEALLHVNFDSKTVWPPADKLPAGFDPQQILELGKDPGFGVRTLHAQGITGQGVGIAIIDQTLLVDHQEYKDRLIVYEEGEDVTGGWLQTSMHGPAVASIAVGKSVGVAPGADLYFIASGGCHGAASIQDFDFSCLAKDIQGVVEINRGLPAARKIRVLSMSIGWGPKSKGYQEITAAVNEAKGAGIFVISTSLSEMYGLNFNGLGRFPLSDPNDLQSHGPGSWWQSTFYQKGLAKDTLLVPMDTRSTASPTGFEDYAFYGDGGWSWCVPYLAGMYALAWQVKPGITPEQFWSTALRTGKTTTLRHDGKDYSFGVILDPQALIAALQK